jgi:hypothetical protein
MRIVVRCVTSDVVTDYSTLVLGCCIRPLPIRKARELLAVHEHSLGWNITWLSVYG